MGGRQEGPGTKQRRACSSTLERAGAGLGMAHRTCGAFEWHCWRCRPLPSHPPPSPPSISSRQGHWRPVCSADFRRVYLVSMARRLVCGLVVRARGRVCACVDLRAWRLVVRQWFCVEGYQRRAFLWMRQLQDGPTTTLRLGRERRIVTSDGRSTCFLCMWSMWRWRG